MKTKQRLPQSELDAAFDRITVNACRLLRKWSDEDGHIGPARIAEFRQNLKQTIAEVYFGTSTDLPA